jgi:hypothetical protein
MKQVHANEHTFFESLSDMSMATLGIFIIFFVINLLYLNNDFIERAVKQPKLIEQITDTKIKLVEFIEKEDEKINNEKNILNDEIEEINKKLSTIDDKINEHDQNIESAQSRLKEVLNVDELISIQEIRKLLAKVKLQRKEVEEGIKRIRLRTNHVRQEFNVYKEIENSHPYLEIKVIGQTIWLGSASVTQKLFRDMLNAINAGSGFRFRMKRAYIDGKYQRPKPPKWLNDLLFEEGWMPIMEE